MGYTTGHTILDDEYNEFAGNLNSIIGTPAAGTGWGQTQVSTVSPGTTISATQWNTLMNNIESAASHTNTSGVSFSSVAGGDTISVINNMALYIDNVNVNRGDLHAHGSNITASQNHTGSWYTQLTFTATTTFASDANAKAFFNAGGQIGINFSSANGSGSKNTGWANLCTAVGTIWLSSAGPSGPATSVTLAGTSYQGTDKKGGSGSVTTESNVGFFDLTSSNQQTFKQFDSTYFYTSNYIAIQYKYASNVVTATVICRDDANTTSDPGAVQDEVVNLDINCQLTVRQPSTTYISNSWGTPSASVSSSAS